MSSPTTAGWKRHISPHPVPDLDADTAAAVASYRSGKGTVRFPLDQPIPFELIARLVRLLAAQRGAQAGDGR
jgi:uncharacterized protein YdhG (YjbR/CyaY superfamily)